MEKPDQEVLHKVDDINTEKIAKPILKTDSSSKAV